MMKKFVIAACSVLLVGCGSIGGYAAYKNPVNFISLDINPSVELGLNSFNQVVSVQGVNEDGQTILEGQDLINKNVTDAISSLVESATDNDFVKDDGSTVIAVTAQSKDDGAADKLQDIGENAVNKAIEEKEVTATVYKDCSDLSLRTEAKELGISPGKLKLIKTLQVLDSTVTIDQFKDAKVSQIMVKAKKLMDTNTDTEMDESKKKAIEKLEKTAVKAQERAKIAEQVKTIKKEAKAITEQAKTQTDKIREDAKAKAEELRKQAEQVMGNMDNMTKEQKAESKANAEELRNQAKSIIDKANKNVRIIKNEAEQQHKEIMKKAEEIKKEAKEAEEQKREAEKKQLEAKKKAEEKKREAEQKQEEARKKAEEQKQEAENKQLEANRKADEQKEEDGKEQEEVRDEKAEERNEAAETHKQEARKNAGNNRANTFKTTVSSLVS